MRLRSAARKIRRSRRLLPVGPGDNRVAESRKEIVGVAALQEIRGVESRALRASERLSIGHGAGRRDCCRQFHPFLR